MLSMSSIALGGSSRIDSIFECSDGAGSHFSRKIDCDNSLGFCGLVFFFLRLNSARIPSRGGSEEGENLVLCCCCFLRSTTRERCTKKIRNTRRCELVEEQWQLISKLLKKKKLKKKKEKRREKKRRGNIRIRLSRKMDVGLFIQRLSLSSRNWSMMQSAVCVCVYTPSMVTRLLACHLERHRFVAEGQTENARVSIGMTNLLFHWLTRPGVLFRNSCTAMGAQWERYLFPIGFGNLQLFGVCWTLFPPPPPMYFCWNWQHLALFVENWVQQPAVILVAEPYLCPSIIYDWNWQHLRVVVGKMGSATLEWFGLLNPIGVNRDRIELVWLDVAPTDENYVLSKSVIKRNNQNRNTRRLIGLTNLTH